MKKLLTILGSIMISASGAALVIACKKPAPNQPVNKDKNENPTNGGGSKKPDKTDEEKTPSEDKKPDDNKKPTNNYDPKIYTDTIFNRHFISGNPSSWVGTIHNSSFIYGSPFKPSNEIKPNESTTPKNPVVPTPSTKPDDNNRNDSNSNQPRPLTPLQPSIPSNKPETKPVSWTNTWYSVYNDSATGTDINLNPTKEQIEKEEKRLEDWVKKYLDKNKRENQALFDSLIKIEYDRIFRDSATGTDINFYLTKEQIEAENKKQEDQLKAILDKNYKDNFANLMAIKASRTVKELFSDEFSDLVKQAVQRYKHHGDTHARESANAVEKLLNDKYNLVNEYKHTLETRLSKLNEELNIHNTERSRIEKEFATRESELETLSTNNLLRLTKDFESEKEKLETRKKENEVKLNELKSELPKIKEQEANAKEEIKDSTELLEDAKLLLKENEDKQVEHNKVLDKAKELDSQINSINKQIESKNQLITDNENKEKELLKEEKKLETELEEEKEEKESIKELDNENKLYERIIEDLKKETYDSDLWFYHYSHDPNWTLWTGFNHNEIARLKAYIYRNNELKKEVLKNIKALETTLRTTKQQNQEQIKQLKENNEKIKGEIKEIEKTLQPIETEKSNITKKLLELNPEIVKTKQNIELYKNNLNTLKEKIMTNTNIQKELSTKIYEYSSNELKLEKEKEEISNSISELEKSINKVILESKQQYENQLLELEKQAHSLESKEDEKIKEIEKTIAKLKESIKLLNQK
ncbi:lipoprotein [Mycoplasma mycoides subsp. capri]|uniref:MAG6090-like repeat-containing lipoprotein n=1 Tax=Mycoplasma mycoides TaxID=2102 RepID=UPI00223EE88B|nr:lipoprotein [Mycoplasma mycoides]UZK64213.1 lipoprotein [Mycoplasma mycoides subsp. capri]